MPVTPQGIAAQKKQDERVANIKKEIISSLKNGRTFSGPNELVFSYDRRLEVDVREAMWQLLSEDDLVLTDGLGLELNGDRSLSLRS